MKQKSTKNLWVLSFLPVDSWMYQVEIPTRLKYYGSSRWYGSEIITLVGFLG